MSSLATIEPVYVIDTHALIWHLSEQKRLGRNARVVFDAAQQNQADLVISVISLAEMYWINRRLQAFDFRVLYQELKKRDNVRFVDIKPNHILEFDKLPDLEMHDRIIVGLARRLKAPLVSHDQQITDSGLVKVIW